MDEAAVDAAVLRVLRASSSPLKASQIADALGTADGVGPKPITRKLVNQCLYFRLKELVVVDEDYAWSTVERSVLSPEGSAADSAAPDGAQLTDAQVDIVERGSDERLLVTAPAGTGKTHVLLNRLVHLVEDEGLHGGDELLVLSFSRAAVREIRRRLASVEGGAGYVRVVTFDSYATWLLSLVDPVGAWVDQTYDDRIRACTKLLQTDEEACEEIERLGHVLVDEAQDLVGVRARLVLELLRHCCSGFTLFGDPSQAIYGFQVHDDEDGPTSQEFYASLREDFADDLDEVRLSKNFRARTQIARSALDFGPMLSEADPDYEAVHELLREMVATELQTMPLDHVIDFLPRLAKQSRRVAVLCRNNGQALVISGELHAAGVDHRLQRRAVERAVGPWLAGVFALYPGHDVDRKQFLGLVEASPLRPTLDPEEAWFALRRSVRADSKTVDLSKLAICVRGGSVVDELNEAPEATLVVSTIHRAKGLEFDDVFIADFDETFCDEEALAEETRLLYVALTRARDTLALLDPPPMWGLSCRKSHDDRWEQRGWGQNSWKRLGIEFSGDDVDKEYPAVGPGGRAKNVAELHDYLIEQVRHGDAVSLQLVDASPLTKGVRYTVHHDERIVGLTSKHFADVLDRFLGYHKWKPGLSYPLQIGGLHVEMLDSVAGTPADAERFNIGPSALWLRPRLVGLGKFQWH